MSERKAAKKKAERTEVPAAVEVPSDDLIEGADSPEPTEGNEEKKEVEGPQYTAGVKIEVPLGTIPPKSYVPEVLNSFRLTQRQGLALKRLTAGLDAAHARLASGSQVDNQAEAVRWLLEQISGE